MPSIAIAIFKHILWNAFVKEIILVPGKVLLGRVILDSLLLAYLLMLDILLVPSTDPRFPIVILPATSMYFKPTVQILPISQPTNCI